MLKRIIVTIFKGVYSVIAFFNLQLALFVFIGALIVYFTGAMQNPAVKLAFDIAFIFSVVIAIILTIRKLLGIGKNPKKSKGVQIVEENTPPQVAQPVYVAQPVAQPMVQPTYVQPVQPVVQSPSTPTYYRVKGKDNYVMAEYSDRYELFSVTPNGLKKVRTDYKN
ncbi:MAG: hypothetical protein IJC07_02095 [Clostridia bacterium]|nr:hypothetical protein [Clostridia bacterium]